MELAAQTDHLPKQGGWITFPFIIATSACLTLGNGGWVSNLIVYMIGEFNVKRIDAAQVFNIVNGCINLFPLLGAIIADSFLGCFAVIWISSFIALLGTVLLTLTSTIDSLRPQPYETRSITCPTPSKFQLTILYAGLALSSLGIGGMRFTLTTMGANQYTTTKEQSIYFNWYFFSLYASAITASTAIVYVEDNVSWAWGFGLCAAANALGLAIFLFGSRFYRHVKPEGSPFTGLVRVFVASIRKRKAQISLKSDDYYRGGHDNGIQELVAATPTTSFRFLNRAALIAQGDISSSDGSIVKPWNLCTLQQVEDLKTLIRIFPLWSSSIFLGTPIGIQTSLLVLQALTMDRRLGPHFTIPAGSMLVSVFFFVCIALILSDRLIRPTWQYLAGRPPTPLQLIGVGHVLNIASMAVSAVVESTRRRAAVPMSVFWLVPQLAIVGVGEAFHFPGQVALYYQEFPASLKNMATATIGLLIGIAFYLSTAVIGCVRTATGWLPDDIDDGKVDYVFWMLVVVGVVNFGYYMMCAVLYKYRNLERVVVQPH
ncbi:protein NRT1/ PTR FAMILY 2.3-like isoform X1 [Rhododendron vialii]|uniref:protein NRT1/ PTR FAMILY 2.3-like isoform X1 n=1 Tax=Rhododendron vialii TaxID=182163 RepID=UPI00265F5796|nr:protein NRT1/ PTR FAMILY 2.3-like isoform X1 [Rhododendron vialii]